ncbi:MAG: DNA-directed RNA polymerase subunit E'' [Candidatus Nanohaloarchaeota archaeon]|nr:DNA-directed RNA polymerase subunit E'' [Candidatus Nanohaloarchaeota archaeon]
MVEKACRQCGRIIEEGNECPVCKTKDLTTTFKGILVIFDPEGSEIAVISGKSVPGKYAVKVVR